VGRRGNSKKQIPLFSTPPLLFSSWTCISYTQQHDSFAACSSPDNLYPLLPAILYSLLAVRAVLAIVAQQGYENGQNSETTGINFLLFLPGEKVVLLLSLWLWQMAGMRYVPAGRRS